jgi:hypothetical protein
MPLGIEENGALGKVAPITWDGTEGLGVSSCEKRKRDEKLLIKKESKKKRDGLNLFKRNSEDPRLVIVRFGAGGLLRCVGNLIGRKINDVENFGFSFLLDGCLAAFRSSLE